MKKIPVIMDCDPGHDDALALVLAFSSSKLDVKAVTVTGGNQTLIKTLSNAKKVLHCLGKYPPLGCGADRPLIRELETAGEVHGASGLDGPDLKIPDDYKTEPAAALMRRIILESPQAITLIPTGPLTNIAILFSAYPEVKQNIKQISLMGGGIYLGGNRTSTAEFNMYVDPEAAEIVFNSGIPIIMAPLDVTHKALVLAEDVAELRKSGGKVSVMAADLIDFFYKYHLEQGFAGAPLHDPCAVAALIAPEIFKTKDFHVKIETSGKHTAGMTVADLRFWTDAKPNVTALLDIDRKAFVNLLIDACKSYD
ncbi:MAG: pyrimidine-specific ribonucleoside hydrolase RihA [Termitinemataceae bacterium]|nr:MAG: pyrimidine-specific ribonucleoside hydrolase RihA [Termitinemataceae bacterium]